MLTIKFMHKSPLDMELSPMIVGMVGEDLLLTNLKIITGVKK